MGWPIKPDPELQGPVFLLDPCFYLLAARFGLSRLGLVRWGAGSMTRLMALFGRWFGVSLAHAFGNPREEQQHLPPPIGVQPYSGESSRHRR
jgi:hypothetical protein